MIVVNNEHVEQIEGYRVGKSYQPLAHLLEAVQYRGSDDAVEIQLAFVRVKPHVYDAFTKVLSRIAELEFQLAVVREHSADFREAADELQRAVSAVEAFLTPHVSA
jgi:hypothetical protein